jgi:hypothetical protein
MDARKPVLGVLVGMRAPPLLRALLVAATDWCYPVACSALEPAPTPSPAAYLWCGGSTRLPAGARYAAWVHHPRDLDHPVARDARVLLCDTVAAAERAGDLGVFVPSIVVDPQARPMLPFARRRLRQARGLPGTVVVRNEADRWYWGECPDPLDRDPLDPDPLDPGPVDPDPLDPDPLDPDLVGTALGCASAVVATTPTGLAAALAWAAAIVTDQRSAAELGARDQEHALVGSGPTARRALAQDLAADDTRAAHLGWSGWLLARRRADIRHSAWTMTRRLGMAAHPAAGRLNRLEDELDLLGTPRPSSTRARAASFVAPLPGPTSQQRGS